MSETQRLVLEGLITPDQQYTYLNLPFDVPAGTQKIAVKYEYDAMIDSDPTVTGGNVVDIGIFDARGAEFPAAGFRGWSGSARLAFEVGSDTATPGYMPGTIMAGTWNIALGAYKIAPDGCHYRVDIALTVDESAPEVAFPARLRMSDAPPPQVRRHDDGWYRGEIHCHTVNSDGDSSVSEIIALAESLDLDFLAITDHNNQTQQIDMARLQSETRLSLIPGYEVTTYYGHWNIWGDGDWVDFRIQSPQDLATAIQKARDNGYLVSCNHPKPFGPDWAFADVEGYDCVEIWNGPWFVLNDISLKFWDERLQQGQRLVAVGGSDHHYSKRDHVAKLAHPVMFIHLGAAANQAPNPAAFIQALRAGHAFVGDSPDAPRVYLTSGDAMMGDTVSRTSGQVPVKVTVQGGVGAVLHVIADGAVIAEVPLTQDEMTVDLTIDAHQTRYVRAQVFDQEAETMRTVTNPIYFA